MIHFYSLCQPARLYIVLSIIVLLVTAFSNYDKPNELRLGNQSIYLGHNNALEIIFNILFVIIWTWMLNKFCKKGWTILSWALVISPFISALLLFYSAIKR